MWTNVDKSNFTWTKRCKNAPDHATGSTFYALICDFQKQLLLGSLFNSNSASNGCTDHRVVAHADETFARTPKKHKNRLFFSKTGHLIQSISRLHTVKCGQMWTKNSRPRDEVIISDFRFFRKITAPIPI